MTGNRNFFNKVLSIILSLILLISVLPIAAFAAPVNTPSNYSASADNHTLDGWKNFFGTQTGKDYELSTEYAGGVWTDKSVFTVPDNLANLPSEFTNAKYNGNGISLANTEDNFLISLSAIASNKEIKGYSTIPTDTVLVLDMSSSMRSKDANGGSAVDELAAAANEAINKLLELNYNNRIGVILYAGNTNQSFTVAKGNTQVLLPLDTYTTSNSQKKFLEPYNNNQSMRVVRNAVKNSKGDTVSGSMATATGTFTQNGIYEAMKLLCSADTTVNSGIQAGADRIPIMVLMTDGEPTLANNSYYGSFNGNFEGTNFNNATLGNSTLSNYDGYTGEVTQPGLTGEYSYNYRDTIAFMSSLTAAFAKKMMGYHYSAKPLLYTLAYGDVVEKRPEALSFLNPNKSSVIQNNLWKSFFTGERVTVYGNRQTTQNVSTTTDLRHLTEADRYYVDGYFHADNSQSSSISEAFQAIVDEIILQSKYYPTLVQTDYNHDGYLTFTDKIGKYMQVRSVEGIVVGNRLFSGAALAKGFTPEDSIFGTVENPKELGDNLIWSIKERLKIDDAAVARSLVDAAYNYKQLYYNSDTDFSNYIGWFAAADGSYVDFYHDNMTEQEINAAKLKGATHFVRSYIYLGDTHDLKGVSSSNMMYMSVRVTEEIDSGDNMVVWKVPASLIPTLTYQIEVLLDENGNPEETKSLSLNEDSASTPIRLLYEVGMADGIYDWNLTEKVSTSYKTETQNAEYGEKQSGYVFYSNKWNAEMDDTTYNAYSHFEPSVANERYYYINDTAVLEKNGSVYTPYSGSTAPKDTGETYYRQFTVYKKLNNGSLSISQSYEQISENALKYDTEINSDDGIWYVKKNTMQKQYNQLYTLKDDQTLTNTLNVSNHPQATHISGVGDFYSVSTLGNNGRLAITPSTGIKLTKTLVAEAVGGNNSFTFTVTASGTGDLTNAKVIRLDQNGDEASRTALPSNGQVTLSGGETVYIIDIAAGTYQVKEERNDDYLVASINDNTSAGDFISFDVADQTVETVEFKNQPRSFGTLTVAKDVIYPTGYNPTAAILNNEFNIDVTFTGDTADLNMITAPSGLTPVNGTGTKKFTVSLKDNSNAVFTSIPQGVSYTVTEQTPRAGYTYKETVYSDTVHTITPSTTDHSVQVINEYKPNEVSLTNIKVVGEKNIIGGDWPVGTDFEIELLKVTDVSTGATQTTGITDTVTSADPNYELDLSSLKLDTIGTHFFQIVEKVPDNPVADMIYDNSIGRFSVTVSDTDNDGNLDIELVEAYSGTELNKNSADNYTVTKDFTNVLTKAVVEIPVVKEIRGATTQQITDLNLKGGIVFGLFNLPTDTAPLLSVTTDKDGNGTIRIPVTQAEIGSGVVCYLREMAPSLNNRVVGMSYDTAWKYAIRITWSANPEEGAIVEWVETDANGNYDESDFTSLGTDTKFTVTNEYTPNISAPLNLSGNKTLNGTNELGGREFSFSVYKTGYNYDIIGVTALETVKNIDNAISFKPIELDAVGMHYLVIKENATSLGGVSTDKDYRVAVEVVKYDDGGVTKLKLANKPLIHQVGSNTGVEANAINFNNIYTISGTTDQTISGTKILTGRPMLTSEFSFKLTEVDKDGNAKVNGIVSEVHNGAANGTPATASFEFDKLVFTPDQIGDHYFTVTEVKGSDANGVKYSTDVYNIKITVEDDGNGGLKSSKQITLANEPKSGIVFNNEYSPRSVSIPIIGVKEVLGKDGDEIIPVIKEKFSFSITETQSNFITLANPGIGTKVIKNSGETGRLLDFGTINFTRAGSRYFVIKEILPTDESGDPVTKKDGYTYDTKQYLVTVKAVDNHKGNLEAEIDMIWIEENPENPNDPIINYNDYPLFTNLYLADASAPVVLSGKKVLTGRDLADKEFTFVLNEADDKFNPIEGKTPLKAQNDADGKFSFEGISYTEIGTYYYVISEQDDKTADITFDKTKYYVTVNVKDDMASGKLVAEYTVKDKIDGEKEAEIVFNNTYNPPSPPETPPTPPTEPTPPAEAPESVPTSPKTGDNSRLELWIALLFVSGFGVFGTSLYGKKKKYRSK